MFPYVCPRIREFKVKLELILDNKNKFHSSERSLTCISGQRICVRGVESSEAGPGVGRVPF